MTSKTSKVATPSGPRKRLHLSCLATPEEARSIEVAASLEGKSRSAFMVDLALERAKRVIEQHKLTVSTASAA